MPPTEKQTELRPEQASQSAAALPTAELDLASVRAEAPRSQRQSEEHLAGEPALHEREEQLRLAIEAAEIGLWDVDVVNDTLFWQPLVKHMFGISPDVPVSMADFYAGLHPDDRARISEAFARAMDSAQRALYDVEYRTVGKEDGLIRWVAAKGRARFDGAGACVRVIGTAIDITARRRAEEQVREERRVQEALGRISHSLIAAQLDLERVVQVVTDAATEISGAAFGAFFYNVRNAQGESYRLYALSGAPREAFERFPQPRNTRVFGTTFRGEAVVRSDDITTDPRYGHNAPYRGLPEGHLPVRSYLAVPVKDSSGGVLGGLFFGHPEPRVFTERTEQWLLAIAAQAAVAFENARLHHAAHEELAQRARMEEELSEANRQKDEFLAMLAHELRNPLTPNVEAASMSAAPRRILVVDDNQDAADSLAMLLGMLGHESRVAYGSKEALAAVASFKPDVALLDLGLPEMNGHELAERLRRLPPLEGVRLVALTGYGQAEDRQRSKAAGFDDHLVKPVDLAALGRALAGL